MSSIELASLAVPAGYVEDRVMGGTLTGWPDRKSRGPGKRVGLLDGQRELALGIK